MSESTNIPTGDAVNVVAFERPITNGPSGANRVFVQAADAGAVQVDYAAGLDAAGPEQLLSQAQYEAMREQLARDGQADLPAYREIHPPPGKRAAGGATTRPNGNTVGRVVGETPASGTSARASNPPVETETPAEDEEGDRVLDNIQTTLDVAGMVPGLGAVTGVANAGISLARGDWFGAGASLLAVIPFGGVVGKAAKAGRRAVKMAEATEKAAAKAAKEAAEKASKEAAEKANKAAAEKAAKEAANKKSGAKVKKSNSAEKGLCGEWLAKMDLLDQGFDEVVAVQNNSGHGVDLIGRNSKTGEVKVWEVKTTDGPKASGLSKDQKKLGGSRFTKDRLERAASGDGNFGKLPNVRKDAAKALRWIKAGGNKATYEKREIFIHNLDKGCMKHPSRKSRSKPWQ